MKNKKFTIVALFLVCTILPIASLGQSLPYTFSANTAAKASEVNANFTFLLERFGVIRETTVNCGTSGTGSGINSAIQNGYNSIVINGICMENIKLDGTEGNIPRLLKLRGANNDASQDKIIDNSGYTEHVLTFNYGGMLVTIDNLTISGGDRGITTWSNINLRIRNSKVEGYKNRGITLQGGSVMEGENLTIDGSYSGATTEEQGLKMWGGAVAYVTNLTITNNQKFGLVMSHSDIETVGNVILTGNGRAINVAHRAAFTSGANINISGSTDRAISVSQGLFNQWGGTISITNTSGNIFNAWMSNININNLTAIGDGSTEKGLVEINESFSFFENLNISNSGGDGIESSSSVIYIDNLTSKNNKDDGIDGYRTNLTVNNSTISDNIGNGIELNFMSNLRLNSSTISSTTDSCIFASRGSLFDVAGTSVISSTNKEAIKIDHNSSGRIRSGVQVTSTASNNGWGVWIRKGGLIEINSGSTIAGNSSAESIHGELGAKIDIDYGATVQSVLCGNDNQTMVILNGSSGNYPSPTIGSNCITVKY